MRTHAIGLCMLVWAAGCQPKQARTLEEAESRLQVGMTTSDVRSIVGGEGPGEWTSHDLLGEPRFPYPVDIPRDPADQRQYFVGKKFGLVVCYIDDKLVAWALSENRSPIEEKIARLSVGQTYEEVRAIMGPDQSNYPGWNGKFLGRRLMYGEGSSSPLTGSRAVLIDLQREVVVSIKTGNFTIGPLPWADDWDPNFK